MNRPWRITVFLSCLREKVTFLSVFRLAEQVLLARHCLSLSLSLRLSVSLSSPSTADQVSLHPADLRSAALGLLVRPGSGGHPLLLPPPVPHVYHLVLSGQGEPAQLQQPQRPGPSPIFLFTDPASSICIRLEPASTSHVATDPLQVLCIGGFGPAMVLLTYVVTFCFSRVQSNRDFVSVISMMVSLDTASPQSD